MKKLKFLYKEALRRGRDGYAELEDEQNIHKIASVYIRDSRLIKLWNRLHAFKALFHFTFLYWKDLRWKWKQMVQQTYMLFRKIK